MTDLRTAAQQALEAMDREIDIFRCKASTLRTMIALRAALAQQAEPVQEPGLSRCPQCNGPADNGHDRSIPPNPYLCTKCMAEMPQPSYNVTVVDDAHPSGIPLEQWQNKPVQEPVACEPQYANDDGWCDWVCPKPRGYLMQCCDCGLIHEVESRVAKYQPQPSEEFEVVDDPDLQLQWRMKRRDDISPQRKPLSLTDLQEALVYTNLIDRDAIDNSEEYDEGSTLAQIDELYRIIKGGV